MPESMTEALYRIAAVFLSRGAFALVYCLVLGSITQRGAGFFLPAVTLVFFIVSSFMLGRGIRAERLKNATEAVNYYSLALSNLLVAIAGYTIGKAAGYEFFFTNLHGKT